MVLSRETIETDFRSYDYLELIAAYLTAKAHADTYIGDLKLVTYSLEEREMEEKIPQKVELYEKLNDGTYVKNGFTYIYNDTEVPKYIKDPDGKIRQDGTKKIKLKDTVTRYCNINIKLIEPSDVYKFYGITETEDIRLEQAYRKNILKTKMTSQDISQSILFLLSENVDNEYVRELLENTELTEEEKAIVYTSSFLIEKVPYEWGGKSVKAGYDNTWYTFTADNKQKGLDCSGFVQWVYRTIGYPDSVWKPLLSTGNILKEEPDIEYSDLKVGDLGLLNHGERINHVGVYLGNDEWIHCSGSANTVTITKNFPFKIFKRVQGRDAELISEIPQMEYSTLEVNEEDVYLLAQTIKSEAGGEGLNGWIAVAEVIKNRMDSDIFEETDVEGTIYRSGQFSDSDRIKDETPSDDMIRVAKEVLKGNLKILNNPNVLYYRNNEGREEDWGKLPFYKTIGHHQFYETNIKTEVTDG